ncbi:MAG: iron-containing alcohol dehydrogenase [Oscillospiraceae bacterium]
MDGLKKAYYRTYQQVFDIGMRCLHWRKPIVISGAGCIRQVPDVLSKSGVTKVMVVTGSHVVKSLGPKLFAALEDAGMPYEVFSEVEANPSVNTVEKIRAQYTDTGCSGFVALGGGSPMDATKGAAARVACPKKSCDDMAGVMRVGKTVPPIVAIPTTSGTGSETTIAAVITDSETHHKYALMDLKLMPLYAILDPELTVGLPPRTTATTGMDALTHAIEAYISWTYNTKESLRLAEEAVKLIFDNLELAYQHGEDLKVRENMMIAAFKAGFAFSRAGVGNVHAIAHTLGGLYNTPHGLANAVILPIVLEDYGEAVYPKLARLCEIAGVKADGTDAEKAQAFIAEIYAMNERMGIPKGFDFIQEEDIPQIITWALAEANPNYPVPVVYNAARCRKVIDTIRAKAAENPPAEARRKNIESPLRTAVRSGLSCPAGSCGLPLFFAADAAVEHKAAEAIVRVRRHDAVDQQRDRISDRGGDQPHDHPAEHVGRVVRHEIVARHAHRCHEQIGPPARGLFACEHERGHAGHRGRHMAGGEGVLALGIRAGGLPPGAEGLYRQRTRPGDKVLEPEVRDERAAAHGAEHADARLARFRKQHQHDAEHEKEDALLAQQRDGPAQRREEAAGRFGQIVQRLQNGVVIARKRGVEPLRDRSQFHKKSPSRYKEYL